MKGTESDKGPAPSRPLPPAHKPYFPLPRNCLILNFRNSQLSLLTMNSYWATMNQPTTLPKVGEP